MPVSVSLCLCLGGSNKDRKPLDETTLHGLFNLELVIVVLLGQLYHLNECLQQLCPSLSKGEKKTRELSRSRVKVVSRSKKEESKA